MKKKVFYIISSVVIALAVFFGWYIGPSYWEQKTADIKTREAKAEVRELVECINSKTQYLTAIGAKRATGWMLYVAYNYDGAPKDEDTYFEREFRAIFSCALSHDTGWGLTVLMAQIEKLPAVDDQKFHYVGKILMILSVRKENLAGALNSPNLNDYMSEQIRVGAVYLDDLSGFGDVYAPIVDIDRDGARLAIEREYEK